MITCFDFERILVISERQDILEMSRRFFKDVISSSIDKCFTEHGFSKKLLTIIDLSTCEEAAHFITSKIHALCPPMIYIAHWSVIDFLVGIGVAERENFIPYPFTEEIFSRCLDRIFKKLSGKTFNLFGARNDSQKEVIPDSIDGMFKGNSTAVKNLRKQILEAAKSDDNVFLLGETGTGKSTAASLIHKFSQRSKKPYLVIKCEQVMEPLAFSLLFGSVKGSYTNAIKDVEGKVCGGKDGVIFFDEFGCFNLETQSLLITFVEDKGYTKLGSNILENINARLIFATNADISKGVRDGTFRSDLYFRISTREIVFPTLKERKEDIPMLIEDYCKEKNVFIDERVINFLTEQKWLGNLRELHHCLKFAIENSSDSHIRMSDIKLSILN